MIDREKVYLDVRFRRFVFVTYPVGGFELTTKTAIKRFHKDPHDHVKARRYLAAKVAKKLDAKLKPPFWEAVHDHPSFHSPKPVMEYKTKPMPGVAYITTGILCAECSKIIYGPAKVEISARS